jgi:hypothetical protein
MIIFFQKLAVVLRKKRQYFRRIFLRKYFKNHNIGPRYICRNFDPSGWPVSEHGQCSRVARWFVFKPKPKNLGKFWRAFEW